MFQNKSYADNKSGNTTRARELNVVSVLCCCVLLPRALLHERFRFAKMETPRTLLSMSLKHVNPVKTARRSSRKSPSRRKKASGNAELQRKKTQITDVPSPVEVFSNTSNDEKTPRSLISEALLQNNIQKTIRIPLHQVHPRTFKRPTENENREKSKPDNSPVKVSIPDSSSHVKENNSANGSPANGDIEDPIVLSSEDETVILDRREKVKRVRLSEVDIDKISESADLESFSDDLLARVKALIQNTESPNKQVPKENVSEKKKNRKRFSEPQLSSTRNRSSLNVSSLSNHQNRKSPRKDATTNTISFHSKSSESKLHKLKELASQSSHSTEIKDSMSKDHEEQIHVDEEAVFPSTTSEVSSDYGPLQLSRITEEGLDLSGENENIVKGDETMHSTPFKNHELSDIEKSAEKIHRRLRNLNPADDSDIWPDSMLEEEDKVLYCNSEVHVEEDSPAKLTSLNVDDTNQTSPIAPLQNILESNSPNVIPIEENDTRVPENKTSQHQEATAKISVKKQPVKRRKKDNDLPFSRAQLSGIVKHYSSLKFSRESLEEIEDLSQQYFDQSASYLEKICNKRKTKKISADDVTNLMKRRKYITDKKTLNVLIEENLPLEYREELIQVATAGNSILT